MRTLKKMNMDQLAEIMPVISEKESHECVGGTGGGLFDVTGNVTYTNTDSGWISGDVDPGYSQWLSGNISGNWDNNSGVEVNYGLFDQNSTELNEITVNGNYTGTRMTYDSIRNLPEFTASQGMLTALGLASPGGWVSSILGTAASYGLNFAGSQNTILAYLANNTDLVKQGGLAYRTEQQSTSFYSPSAQGSYTSTTTKYIFFDHRTGQEIGHITTGY